jgi:hypothetical protein
MTNIYKDKEIYDNKGDHIYWAVNGHRFGRFDYKAAPDQYFKFDYEIPFDTIFTDYQTEVRNGLIKIYQKYKKTLAICVSGKDSEIILREAVYLGIPCKMYFLDLWGINHWMCSKVIELSKELSVELVVVSLTEQQCLEEVIFDSYKIMSTLKPTYLCVPYLFKNIPTDEFIIVGEGDLGKDNPVYSLYWPKDYNGIPILSSEIVYRIWAQENKRYGEFYFHSSTPELVLSGYNHPLLYRDNPMIYTDKMYNQYWPELKFKQKTANFENNKDTIDLIKTILLNLKLQEDKVVGTFVPNRSVARSIPM